MQLTEARCNRVFVDKVSGKQKSRRALEALLTAAPGQNCGGPRLGRLDGSLRHLLVTVADFERRGVSFIRTAEAMDTSTPGWTTDLPRLRGLAEFERGTFSGSGRWLGMRQRVPEAAQVGRPTVRTADNLGPPEAMRASRRLRRRRHRSRPGDQPRIGVPALDLPLQGP